MTYPLAIPMRTLALALALLCWMADVGGTDDGAPLPHIFMDEVARTVDIDATVVLREGAWLELLACLPGTRTHESILTVKARPSHIHLALMALGVMPGTPLRWVKQPGGGLTPVAPTGQGVRVSIMVPVAGRPMEVPASRWVLNKLTGEAIEGDVWVFAGSRVDGGADPARGESPYRADSEGSVISIVNFGDEVLARPTATTDKDDDGAYVPWTERIPAVGTPVMIRLRPVEEAPGDGPG